MDQEQIPSLFIKSFLSQLNNEEKVILESWIEESDENFRTYSQVKTAWERSRSQENDYLPDVELAFDRVNQMIRGTKYKHTKRTLTSVLKIAAVLVLIMALGAALLKIRDDRLPEYLSYASGNSPAHFVLPDSSAIWLGRNSTLHYPEYFSGRKRQVVLEGLAYFNVWEDRELPFVVKTGNVYTEVSGTSFTVECIGSGDVEVILESGSVSMYKWRIKKDRLELSPGDKGIYSISRKSLHRSINENQNFLSWKTRELWFYDTPLHELCSELARCYGIQVRADQEDKDLRFTGSFSEESLEDVIRIVELTLGTRIDAVNPR